LEVQQLSEEKARIEQAELARRALLRSVSHDLRTPLAAIRAITSDLRAGTNYDEATRDELLDVVVDEAERLDRLVANLLSLSRIEAGALEPDLQAIDLDEMLADRVSRLTEQGSGDTRWLAISEKIQEVMRSEMESRGKAIYPNVDFFSASVYYTLGIPTDLFTNVFACARMAGWTAHIMEQHRDNRLIRPKSDYNGPNGLHVQPIDQRNAAGGN
jgi:citrate synthase